MNPDDLIVRQHRVRRWHDAAFKKIATADFKEAVHVRRAMDEYLAKPEFQAALVEVREEPEANNDGLWP